MIANTFIKRPVTAIVISLVLIISGLICLFNLAVDQYPNISPPSVSVNGSYTGADAQTVEQTVVTAESQEHKVEKWICLENNFCRKKLIHV